MPPGSILEQTLFGNTLENYLWFAGILFIGLVFKKLISKLFSVLLYRVFRKQSYVVGIDHLIALVSPPFQLLIMVIIVYLACNRLSFPHEWQLASGETFGLRFVLDRLFRGMLVVSIFWLILRMVDFFGLVLMARASRTESKADDQLVPFLKEGIKVILAGVGLLILLASVFELDVVSLVTGLGIGGLAIALAAKETLENLFGSFTIFLDKPFKIGDQVKVGSVEGFVESIGFRSTRIRALDRMLVTLPNRMMVEAELINETERVFRRSRMTVGLRYDTPPENIQRFLEDIRSFLAEHPQVEPVPIVRFRQFGESSLEILISVILRAPEFEFFMEVQEGVNFKILELARKNACEFAFPSRSIYMEGRTE